MAYIGTKPTVGNFQICDAISVVNGQAAYTMQVGSVNVIPQSANHMIVSLNGTIQKPNSSYTVSGSTITFASNLVTGDVIDFIQILGDVLDLGVPSDATVTTAKLADSSVTTAKLNDASVSLAKLTATGTKDATTFLRGDNTFDTPPLGGITMADTFNLTSSASGSLTPISSNLARSARTGQGGINPGMTESSGIFTFPSTGVYYVTFTTSFQLNGDSRYIFINIQATTNNSSYSAVAETVSFIQQTSSNITYAMATCSSLIDVTDTSNVKVKFHVGPENSSVTTRGGAQSETFMTFIRLGDT